MSKLSLKYIACCWPLILKQYCTLLDLIVNKVNRNSSSHRGFNLAWSTIIREAKIVKDSYPEISLCALISAFSLTELYQRCNCPLISSVEIDKSSMIFFRIFTIDALDLVSTAIVHLTNIYCITAMQPRF